MLNATFGNAPELIIGTVALHAGLADHVKASITGSIIGNVLLVFGGSALVGRSQASRATIQPDCRGTGDHVLLLSSPIVPAVFHRLAAGSERVPKLELHSEIALVLFTTYCISLVFTLKTHRALYGLPIRRSVGRSSPVFHSSGSRCSAG